MAASPGPSSSSASPASSASSIASSDSTYLDTDAGHEQFDNFATYQSLSTLDYDEKCVYAKSARTTIIRDAAMHRYHSKNLPGPQRIVSLARLLGLSSSSIRVMPTDLLDKIFTSLINKIKNEVAIGKLRPLLDLDGNEQKWRVAAQVQLGCADWDFYRDGIRATVTAGSQGHAFVENVAFHHMTLSILAQSCVKVALCVARGNRIPSALRDLIPVSDGNVSNRMQRGQLTTASGSGVQEVEPEQLSASSKQQDREQRIKELESENLQVSKAKDRASQQGRDDLDLELRQLQQQLTQERNSHTRTFEAHSAKYRNMQVELNDTIRKHNRIVSSLGAQRDDAVAQREDLQRELSHLQVCDQSEAERVNDIIQRLQAERDEVAAENARLERIVKSSKGQKKGGRFSLPSQDCLIQEEASTSHGMSTPQSVSALQSSSAPQSISTPKSTLAPQGISTSQNISNAQKETVAYFATAPAPSVFASPAYTTFPAPTCEVVGKASSKFAESTPPRNEAARFSDSGYSSRSSAASQLAYFSIPPAPSAFTSLPGAAYQLYDSPPGPLTSPYDRYMSTPARRSGTNTTITEENSTASSNAHFSGSPVTRAVVTMKMEKSQVPQYLTLPPSRPGRVRYNIPPPKTMSNSDSSSSSNRKTRVEGGDIASHLQALRSRLKMADAAWPEEGLFRGGRSLTPY